MALIIKSGSFAIGASTTDPIACNEYALCGISTGSTLTATSLSFLVSVDGTTYTPLYTSASEVTISASPVARGYALDSSYFIPWKFIKAREGTSASPVLQASNTANIKLVFKSVQ